MTQTGTSTTETAPNAATPNAAAKAGTTYKYNTVQDLPGQERGELFQLLLALTDTKQRLGFQDSHWVTGTPALEGAVGAAALAQDELGHARTLYTLLRTFPEAPESLSEENDLKSTRVRVHPAALDEKWDTWLKLIAMSVTLDAALQQVFDLLKGSSFGPLAGIATKIAQEEKFHRVYGETWLTRLAEHDDATRQKMQKEIDWAYPIAESWLGHGQSGLVAEGIVTGQIADLKAPWRTNLSKVLDKAGLKLPAERSDWSSWNADKREVASA